MGLSARIKDFVYHGIEEDEEEEFVDEGAPQAGTTMSYDPRAGGDVTQYQAVLCAPQRFDDAVEIVDHLLSNHLVLLNLTDTSEELSHRLIDFLAGAVYAKNGQFRRIASGLYIIAPYNVDVMKEDISAYSSSSYMLYDM